jgi:hypothetical protein
MGFVRMLKSFAIPNQCRHPERSEGSLHLAFIWKKIVIPTVVEGPAVSTRTDRSLGGTIV